MTCTVLNKAEITKVKGKNEIKIKYTICLDGVQYNCLWWPSLDLPIVYDVEFDEYLSNYSWHKNTAGYAYTCGKYMHQLVCQKINIEIRNGLTIDHINGYKLDNRKENLRAATCSQQNSNRPLRCDKAEPCEELKNAGVMELPRYVRWDATEKKFIIEKHPYLKVKVSEGLCSKPFMSGSKSKTLTILEKYQDILARLQDLDAKINDQDMIDFVNKKERLSKEYEAICKCIKVYEGIDVAIDEEEDLPQVNMVEPKKRTEKGKKTVSKLLPNCGVKHEDIPKYCYYSPASEKRGDKFVIDKHPILVKQGKRQWSTTEKTSLTTREKFDILMAKYNELENTNVAS